MAEVFADLLAREGSRQMDPVEWIGLMLDRESAARDSRRFQKRLRAANQPLLWKALFPSLTCCWALPCLFSNSPIKSNSMAVGDHETYFGEQLTRMPLELVDHAALVLPAVRLVLEVLANASDPSLQGSPNPSSQPISPNYS